MKKYLFIQIFILLILNPIFSELSLSTKINQYNRDYNLVNSLELDSSNFKIFSSNIRNNSDYREKLSKTLFSGELGSLILYFPEAFITYNSLLPNSYNDGAIWQGRGFNNRTTLGLEYFNEYASLRIYPEFWVAQNSNFDILETSSSQGYGDYWTIFDNLQRYGDSSYSEFNFGKSDIRFYYQDKITLGVSNENIKLGPGEKNNIILGSQGSGFPHVDFGTLGLVPLYNIGEIEIKSLYGILEESDFYDNNEDNNYGWYSGITLGFSPSFFKNITLGLNHYYTKPLEDWDNLDLVRNIPGVDITNNEGDTKDVMASFTFNLHFPTVGLNLYGELARNDSFTSTTDLWRQPEHTSAYTLGLKHKLYSFSNGSHLLISLEMTELGQQRTRELRAAGPWYRHSWAGYIQGYTNKGQLLGSAIGPGSNSQWGQLSYVSKKGIFSFSIQRIAHDKDYYYYLFAKNAVETGINKEGDTLRQYTEAIIAIDALYYLNNMDIYGRLEYNPHFYHNYINIPTINNIHLEIGINYKF